MRKHPQLFPTRAKKEPACYSAGWSLCRDPATAFPDQGRPVHLLEDREKVAELI